MKENPARLDKNTTRVVGLSICLLLLLLIAYFETRGLDPGKPAGDQLIVYAFSTQEEVFTQGIFPAFVRYWETTRGEQITISGVFGSSGTLAGQISLGAPADVAVLSSENHLNYLIISRAVNKDTRPVYIGSSPVVIVTRPGNPARIAAFGDLARSGLILIQADPRSSGVGEWSLLAEYGSFYLQSKDQTSSLEQVRAVWKNVRLIAPSARSALTLFELGAGDALITYEQDALLAVDRGIPLEIVIPDSTILAEPVAVGIDSNITRSERQAVDAFLEFLSSPEARQIFSSYYLRTSAPESSGKFRTATTFTTADLGGWSAAYSQLLKPYWNEHIFPELSLLEESTLISPEN